MGRDDGGDDDSNADVRVVTIIMYETKIKNLAAGLSLHSFFLYVNHHHVDDSCCLTLTVVNLSLSLSSHS